MGHLVIGIEGLVGSGKTTICRELLELIPDSVLFHGGNLYRAIVYSMLSTGKSLEELKKNSNSIDIKKMMDFFGIEIKIENNETVIYVNGKKIDEDELQSKENSIAVSTISGSADNRNLFVFAKDLINKYKENYNVIVSGRSLMKIYPDCDYHFFITASLDERVKRKQSQYGNKDTYNTIKENILKRDELQEKAGFYEFSNITKEIDVTNCKSAKESAELVLSNIKME